LNKLNKGIVFSIIFHLILVFIFSQQFSQAPLQTVKKISVIKPIQAVLYFPPVKQQTVEAPKRESPVIEKSIPTKEKVMSKPLIETTTEKTVQETVKTNISPEVLPTPKLNRKVLTSDISSKSIAESSLEKLQQRLNTQALEFSQNDSFNQYLTEKNTIAPSITKFNQLPVAKAKVKEVDCNGSSLNTTVMAISGLLGGSVRCNSMPDLKHFLDKRLKERGR